MSDVSQWSDFKRQVVPHRVVFDFHLSAPLPDSEIEAAEKGYTVYRGILTAVFEGWCPPIPQIEDRIAFDRGDGDIHIGEVSGINPTYGPDGITYEILVDNKTYPMDTTQASTEDEDEDDE